MVNMVKKSQRAKLQLFKICYGGLFTFINELPVDNQLRPCSHLVPEHWYLSAGKVPGYTVSTLYPGTGTVSELWRRYFDSYPCKSEVK